MAEQTPRPALAAPRHPREDDLGADRRIWIAILDDSGWMRATLQRGLAALLPECRVTADASLRTLQAREPEGPQPGVALIGDPHDAAPDLRATVSTLAAAGSAVIVLSNSWPHEHAQAAGASLVLERTAPLSKIVDAMFAAVGTRYPIRTSRTDGRTPALPAVGVTPREATAVRLHIRGLPLAGVARSMGVGYETAKTLLRRVREKATRAGHATRSRTDLLGLVRQGILVTRRDDGAWMSVTFHDDDAQNTPPA